MSRPCSAFCVAVVSFLWLGLAFAEGSSARLANEVVPTFQAIDLAVDADQPDYTGSVRIELNVLKRTNTFRFHARRLVLKKVVLTGQTGPVSLQHKTGEHDQVIVTTAGHLAPGDYTLEIEFANEFNTVGSSLHRVESDGHWYVFTQFAAIESREAFPCWDEPAFKIPFQVTMTVPAGHLAVSNTPVETDSAGKGQRRVVFMRTKPMPAYLLAMAAGPLETVPIPGMSIPGRVITVKGKSHLTAEAVRATPPLLAALEKYLGSSYPYRKLDLLAVPERFGAMENVAAVTFSESLLLLDSGTASDNQRMYLTFFTAHELAHMWFGNLVTLQWWDDTWLNESFATWMGNEIADQVFPQYKIGARQVGWAQSAMVSDGRLSTRVIGQKVEIPTMVHSSVELAYTKGGTVLSMFEQWLGPEIFQQGVRSYLNKHQWSNAVAQDFWSALDGAAKVNISTSMATYFEQAGLPLVTARVLADGRVELSQKRFLNYGVQTPATTEPILWHIPVVLRWSDGRTTQTQKVLLKEQSRTIALEGAKRPVWIHPNAGESGYYRWTVEHAMLMSLVKDATSVLGVPERLALAGHIAALMDAGQIKGDEYLHVLERLAADPRPEVVEAVASTIWKARAAFVTLELEDAFAVYVRRMLRPALDRFGRNKVTGEEEVVTMLRPSLLKWLGVHGRDQDVLQFAEKTARKYIDDAGSVDSAIAGTCLQLAALQGDRAMYDTYKRKFESAQIPTERRRYLGAFGYFRDPGIITAALDYSLHGPLQNDEIVMIPVGIASALKNEESLFQWSTENYEAITSRLPREFAAFMPMFASGCSAERLAAARAFYSEPAHQVPGTLRQLEKVGEAITDCVSLRQREGQAVADYLRKLYAGN
jgi:alanyl aminopeptidase